MSQPQYAGRPSVCRNCGALVGAGETACAQCGAAAAAAATTQPAPQSRTEPVYDHETMRFARAVFSRPYFFTIVFLVANVFVFLLMWGESRSVWEFPVTTLIAYGAKSNYLIDAYHQWWRFVTPVFIHVGVLHLLINMYSLWMIGPYVERLYGSARFVVFWVVTGVAGVGASYLAVRPSLSGGLLGSFLFKAQDVPSAGASGALFGLIGVLFVFGLKYRHELPEGFKRAFGTGMLPIIFINLFIGFAGRGFIDNAAHVGGLLSGALLATFVGYKRPGQPRSVSIVWHILQGAALLLVAASFLMIARNYSSIVRLLKEAQAAQQAEENAPKAGDYLKALNDGESAFAEARKDGNASGLDSAIKEMDDAPGLDEEATRIKNELRSILVRKRDFLQLPPDQRSKPDARKQFDQLAADHRTWVENRNKWVEAEGKKYGFYLKKESSNANSSSEK